MTRKKNSSFVGGTVRDTRIGTATFTRLIENAAGDTALTFDKATGSNSEAGVIVHDGGDGTGALLGMPIVNHWVGRSMLLTSPTTKGSSGGLGDTWFYPTAFHLATGETELRVEVCMKLFADTAELAPYAKVVTASSGATADLQPLVDSQGSFGEDNLYTAHLTGLTAGWNILLLGLDTSSAGATNIGKLQYVRARPRKSLGGHIGSAYERGNAHQPVYDEGGSRAGVSTPSATEGVVNQLLHAATFADLESIDGYTLSRLNRNINGLAEFITGFPAGGNQAYVHEDQDGTATADDSNPARSRFEAHTCSLYASEGELDFPLLSESFGSFLAAGLFSVGLAEPPTVGALGCFAPWISTANETVEHTIHSVPVRMPDFQSASSRLQCAVLIGSEHNGTADPTQWTIKAATSAGSATAAPVAVTGFSSHLWLATISAIPFTGDAASLLQIKATRSGSKPAGTDGIGEICFLGAGWAFAP